MRNSKKLTSLLFALILMLTVGNITFAENDLSINRIIPDGISMDTVDKAYMNLNVADKALQKEILDARKAIIYSTSWSDDDTEAYSINAKGEIIAKTPKFHDIFPADWEIPVAQEAYSDLAVEDIAQADIQDVETVNSGYLFYNKEVYLTTPSSEYTSSPFITYTGRDAMFMLSTPTIPGQSYNFGIRNNSTNRDIYNQVNIPRAEGFLVSNQSGVRYSCRASTYSTSGYGYFTGSYAYDI